MEEIFCIVWLVAHGMVSGEKRGLQRILASMGAHGGVWRLHCRRDWFRRRSLGIIRLGRAASKTLTTVMGERREGEKRGRVSKSVGECGGRGEEKEEEEEAEESRAVIERERERANTNKAKEARKQGCG